MTLFGLIVPPGTEYFVIALVLALWIGWYEWQDSYLRKAMHYAGVPESRYRRYLTEQTSNAIERGIDHRRLALSMRMHGLIDETLKYLPDGEDGSLLMQYHSLLERFAFSRGDRWQERMRVSVSFLLYIWLIHRLSHYHKYREGLRGSLSRWQGDALEWALVTNHYLPRLYRKKRAKVA